MTLAEKRLTFIEKVAELRAQLTKGERTAFDCPICGKTAIASRSPFNGHIRANCPHCNILINEQGVSENVQQFQIKP